MLKDLLVNEAIPQLLYIVITVILGIVSYYVKQFLDSHKAFLEVQKEQLISKIGEEKYKQDITIAKQIIMAVEQMGKEFDWESAIKHSKATEMISKQTGLKDEEIFNIIKATVGEFNKNRDYSLKKAEDSAKQETES